MVTDDGSGGLPISTGDLRTTADGDEIVPRLRELGPDRLRRSSSPPGAACSRSWLLTDDVGPRRRGELPAASTPLSRRAGQRAQRPGLGAPACRATTNHKADPVPYVERGDLDRRYVPEYLAKRLPAAEGKRSRPRTSTSATRRR